MRFHPIPAAVLGVFGLLQFTSSSLHAQETNQGEAREITVDRTIIRMLNKEASLVIVGAPVKYHLADTYRLALTEDVPFEVKVITALRGEGVQAGQVLRVSVNRPHVGFRYEKGKQFVFFLKPFSNRHRQKDPNFWVDWRIVADHFGVIFDGPQLQQMIAEEGKQEGQETEQKDKIGLRTECRGS